MKETVSALIVDDSEFFAEMTAKTLAEDHGMETHWARNAAAALELLADTRVDCIVSDYKMPGADGLEFKSMVNERYGDLPFIILTGRGDEETASKAIAAGVDDYILKLEVVEDQQYQRLANRIESAVAQQRATRRYELLVENTPDAVAQVSSEGQILAANPAMAALGEPTQEEMEGARLPDVLPDGIGEEWLAVGREVIDSGETENREARVGDRYFQNIFVPVDIRTERDTFQLIARDVTEHTERERELQRQNERLDRFASMVSHDLRNPLDIAEVHLSLLDDEFEETPPDLQKVRESHQRMERLIDDVLTLARQGATVDEPEPAEFGAIAEEMWHFVEAEATDLAVDAEGEIVADPGRLQELLSNLFRNAVEHGGASTIVVRRIDGGFVVEDDGTGIEAQDVESVFEAGFSTADDGTGFGLAIVEQIAAAHGWEVTVGESEAGGARFQFTGVTFA